MAIHSEATHAVLHKQLRLTTREADFLINTARDDGKASGVPTYGELSGTIVTVHHAGNSLFTIEIH